ncbi:hypothetical protein DM860_010439 [Cuscuta australis]|uniref:Uncharacterized protein n=1 Tax=Cuscuta australis TaxID=267555 RepID=A0A328E5K5_9ASTE|nr:hypothetical protein DM860_010439 [Cuscuta australis]
MMSCLGQSSSSTNTQLDVNTPISSDQTTPSSVNLTKEYAVAIQSASYSEIWSKIHYEVTSYHGNGEEELQVEEVLKPSRECVKDALSHIKPYTLSQIVINYFEHSEQTTQLCLSLARCIHRAHQLYSPLHKLLDCLSIDFESPSSSAKNKVGSNSKYSLSQPQCAWAFDAFKKFVELDNPFPSPDSHSFSNMHSSFTQLKHHLDIHLQKSRSKVQLLRGATKGAAVCLIVTTVGVVITATVIAAHALVALVASPICPFIFPSKMTEEEMARLVQLDDAAKGIFVLHNHLETVDCLVARLHNAMEDYNRLVRFGIERGNDSYPIQEVIFQLQKRHDNFLDQLNALEEHLCLCLAAINRARSLLLNCFRVLHYHS